MWLVHRREKQGEIFQPTIGTSLSILDQHAPSYEEEHLLKNNFRHKSGIYKGRMTPHAPSENCVSSDTYHVKINIKKIGKLPWHHYIKLFYFVLLGGTSVFNHFQKYEIPWHPSQPYLIFVFFQGTEELFYCAKKY